MMLLQEAQSSVGFSHDVGKTWLTLFHRFPPFLCGEVDPESRGELMFQHWASKPGILTNSQKVAHAQRRCRKRDR
jgi:hypothetical protein